MVNRKDFRPNSSVRTKLSDKDRIIIRENSGKGLSYKDKSKLKDSQIFSSQVNVKHTTSYAVPSYLNISRKDYNKVVKYYNGDTSKANYTIVRAEGGHDNIASKELLEIKNPNWKQKVKPKGHYIIARKMIDDDCKEKYFTYYPSETHGKSPYMYKTKTQADKVYAKQKFPSDQSNTKVVRSEDVIYLDRY